MTHFLAGVPAEDFLCVSQPDEADHLPPGLERDAAADQSVSPALGFSHTFFKCRESSQAFRSGTSSDNPDLKVMLALQFFNPIFGTMIRFFKLIV